MADLSWVPNVGDVIHDKYQIIRRIGAGSFGSIFEAQDINTGKIIALKLERPNSQSPQLHQEYQLYKLLDAPPGISKVYDYWIEDRFRGMAMDRLGYSLGHLFHKCGKILSLKTVAMIAIQMMSRIEYLHQRSFIHRDIKPDNFVFGVGSNSNLLYIIDFGLAQKYRDLKTFVHRNYSEDNGLAGTTRYVSINVHLGVQQNCRDDLESIGYVLIQLVKGKLPWQNVEEGEGDKYDAIKQCKMDTPLEVLCEDLPPEFLYYMSTVRGLRYDEKPPYHYLRNLFIKILVANQFPFDYKYDWVISRARRLDEALRGHSDQNTLIPVSAPEIIAAKKKDAHHSGFMQLLPFLSTVFYAADFVSRSKNSVPDYVEEDLDVVVTKKDKKKKPKQQEPEEVVQINALKKKYNEAEISIFLLDPKKSSSIPIMGEACEFTLA